VQSEMQSKKQIEIEQQACNSPPQAPIISSLVPQAKVERRVLPLVLTLTLTRRCQCAPTSWTAPPRAVRRAARRAARR
jgi:hypothetical protein